MKSDVFERDSSLINSMYFFLKIIFLEQTKQTSQLGELDKQLNILQRDLKVKNKLYGNVVIFYHSMNRIVSIKCLYSTIKLPKK